MASTNPTSLLDLVQAISNAALLITKCQLQEQQHAATPYQHIGLNGTATKALEGVVRQDCLPSTEQMLEAKANLVQAASDLTIMTIGPANYLKSLSYGVSQS